MKITLDLEEYERKQLELLLIMLNSGATLHVGAGSVEPDYSVFESIHKELFRASYYALKEESE